MDLTYARINLSNLKYNLDHLRKVSGGKKICCPVKADAYGHGLIEVSKFLESQGVDYLAVSRVKEIEALLKVNIKTKILLLSLLTPREIANLPPGDIEFTIDSTEYAKNVENYGKTINKTIGVHLKVETGMGRVGCFLDEISEISEYIKRSPYLKLIGLSTHLSSGDTNIELTNSQFEKFYQSFDILKNNNNSPMLIHSSNSAGALYKAENFSNMIRPGIALYGYYPGEQGQIELKPVLELITTIVRIKKYPKGSTISYGGTYKTEEEELIGILPVGYADGLPRALSNKGQVLINGNIYPIVGRICMDQTLIKIDPSVSLYSEVKLISSDDKRCSAETIAELSNTISYEILTNLQILQKKYILGVD